MRIIDRLRLGGSSPSPIYKYPDLKLQQELKETKQQLNSILNKWKFGDAPIKSASEFLNNFEPWIKKQLEQQKELKEFLKNQGVNNLSEIKEVPESEQLKFYKENIKIKEGIINDYKKDEELWKNTEQDYLKQIQELKKSKETSTLSEEDQEKLNNYEGLITDLDELKRDKTTLEQQNLALNNQVKNKQQEVTNKDKALEKLKKEKDQLEVNHQKQLKEKNSLISTLNFEIKQVKTELETKKKNSKREYLFTDFETWLKAGNSKLIGKIEPNQVTKFYEHVKEWDDVIQKGKKETLRQQIVDEWRTATQK